jgi:subtilisin family serine protease
MKMDFRRLLLTLVSCASLSACGPQRLVGSSFRKASDECQNSAVPNKFIVRYWDGRTATVHAPSEEEFINGFLSENLNEIAFAEHDYKIHLDTNPSVSASEDGNADNWGVARVAVDSLWQQGIRGAGVPVAVIDSGMDITHVQLRKQVYTNGGEQGVDASGKDRSTNGADDDGNGYVDDAFGWNYVHGHALTGDNQYHGTHVSGIIAAQHWDTEAKAAGYVQGMAPEAKILPLAFLNSEGSGDVSDAILAMQYAVQRGAKVINASWGSSNCSLSLREAIAGLEAHKVIFVAAAGNAAQNTDRDPMYPAAYDLPALLTVGAVGSHDLMSKFSNFGVNTVHIFAPGAAIVSTYPGDSMASLNGTSMAAPFVTGAVALLLSAEPNATVSQIRASLYETAAKRTDYINESHGRLFMTSALTSLRAIINSGH